ncbi:MAG TPA: cell division protein ZapA [Ramlibacter sp.]|nr:cell division protein ZapA [Ramlibacter sp.]
MNQLEVQIMGQSYLLGCPEGGEHRLREAVEKVDGAMCRIRDAGKVKARDRIAVLAALNLAFDLGDRPAPAPVAAAPAPSPMPAADLLSDDDNERLATLTRRLDKALGDDGRLL